MLQLIVCHLNDVPIFEGCWLSYKCHVMALKVISSISFPVLRSGSTDPSSSFLTFATFQSAGASLVHQDCWEVMGGSSMNACTSSLNTLVWIPSGFVDLCVSQWSCRSLTVFLWIRRASFCSESYSSGLKRKAGRDFLLGLVVMEQRQWF